MPANTFGEIFRVTTFGESHGVALGCVIDGCPPGIEISQDIIQNELDRRKPGQSKITTQRKESEKAEILSGVFEGKTTGTPIAVIVYNENQKSEDYTYIKDKYRPSHADYTYQQKYGVRDYRGGGRSSARETVGRVIAGSIAKKILKDSFDIEILAFVNRVKDVYISSDFDDDFLSNLTSEKIEANIVRCPNQELAQEMIELIQQTKKNGDSIGGEIVSVIKNPPAGLGEPVFDKLEALLSQAMMSIPSVKSFEVGSGLIGTFSNGSDQNDFFYTDDPGSKIKTKTNNSGGIQGGISNGQNIYFKVGFKPVATIDKKQQTVDLEGNNIHLENIKGRHDACVLPRAVPIVEAMSAITILDSILRQSRIRVKL